MDLKVLKVGEIQTNCYIISDPESIEALIIDPGDEIYQILENVKGLKVKGIVLTHGHWDHSTHAPTIAKTLGVPLYLNRKDEPLMYYANQSKADKSLKEGDVFEVGSLKFGVIETPGHSPGGICLYDGKKNLFSGDTIFYQTYGRVDLPYGSEEDMIKSLKKLMQLPKDTTVYPGHGQATTIGEEYTSWFKDLLKGGAR